jgi:hypothetical protein
MIDCISFPDYLKASAEATNKVGFLILAFQRLHPHAPAEDLAGLNGRMAQLWTIAHKDTGYLLKIIWISAAEGIAGSHLNYIQGILTKKNGGKFVPNAKLSKPEMASRDPNKYITGRYGHVVQG